MVNMVSPIKTTEASALQNQGDKTFAKADEISLVGPTIPSAASTKTPSTRASLKRRHSESPTRPSRVAPTRLRTSLRKSYDSISAAQKGAMTDDGWNTNPLKMLICQASRAC